MTAVTRPALLSAVAYILQAAGITVAELAQHMGQKLEAAPIVLPPRPAPDPDRLLPRELDVPQRIDNPDGASVPELMAMLGLSIQAISGYVGKLERLGRIVRVKAPGVRAPRCFVDPAAAQRWHDSHQAAADAALQDAKRQQAEQQAAKLRRAAELAAAREAERKQKAAAPRPVKLAQSPTVLPKKPQATALQGPAVETEATRKTVDSKDRPTARWQTQQLEPDPRWPSFASAPLGVNPDTGRPWA